MGCVMLGAMHLGGLLIRHLCGDLNNFPSPPLSEVQSLLVLIFVLACYTAGYGRPHPPHVLSPDDIIRHAGEAQAQPLGGKQKLEVK